MICGHGSRDGKAVDEFVAFTRRLEERLSDLDVESGFLQYSRPAIRDGLEALKKRSIDRIVCLPCMLFAAGHVKNDLPSEISAFSQANPGVETTLARELGVDAKMLRLAAERIEEAENASPSKVERSDSLLLVVGRGTSDSDANSNVAKVARMLWEGMGFGWAEAAFSGVAEPDVGAALAQAAKLDYGRIVVLPYFLFTGVQVKGVLEAIAEAEPLYPGKEIVVAGHLAGVGGGHQLLIDCFAERLEEALTGVSVMNCQDCDAREKIVASR